MRAKNCELWFATLMVTCAASGAWAGETCQRWSPGFLIGGSSAMCTTKLDASRIVVGGLFTQDVPNQNQAHNLIVWNGLTLSRLVAIGGGEGTNGMVRAMKTITTGGPFGGTTLYIGGDFTVAGGLSASRIVRWSEPSGGALPSWSAMGSGFNGSVHCLEIHNNELYAGGSFTMSGTTSVSRIAKWNGTAWQAVGGGIGGPVFALKSHGGFLYAGGDFTTANGQTTGPLVRWDGQFWGSAGLFSSSGDVFALETWNGMLAVGGSFTLAGLPPNLGAFNGFVMTSIGGYGTNGGVYALKADGDALYIGGNFTFFGPTGGMSAANGMARCHPQGAWSNLANGVTGGGVRALEPIQSEMHAVGSFAFVGSPSVLSPAWARYLTTGAAWIAQQPVNTTVNCYSSGNLGIQIAAGYGTVSYQWKRFGEPLINGTTPHGSIISGANAAALSITNAKTPDIGAYQCVVQSGSCGSATSTAVTLRVNSCCEGDIAGGDLLINIDDLLVVVNAWGWTGPVGGHPGDINGSGQVEIDDLLEIVNRWGACPPM